MLPSGKCNTISTVTSMASLELAFNVVVASVRLLIAMSDSNVIRLSTVVGEKVASTTNTVGSIDGATVGSFEGAKDCW